MILDTLDLTVSLAAYFIASNAFPSSPIKFNLNKKNLGATGLNHGIKL